MSLISSSLEQGWYWKQRDTDIESVVDELPSSSPLSDGIVRSWHPATSFPSEVHVELLKIGTIPHPYVAFNEHKVQWIGDADWLYYCTFIPSPGYADRCSRLTFEGLDTICDIYLNSSKVLEANNMFRTYSIVLDNTTLDSKSNTLLLHFKSAKKRAKEEEKRYGRVRAGSTNLGDPSRVYVRKAQYDWRWDWGPELMTCGPFRPIRFESYTAKICELQPCINIQLADLPATFTANVSVNVVLDVAPDGDNALSIYLKDSNGTVVAETAKTHLPLSGDTSNISISPFVRWTLDQSQVNLWWPVGYGEQPLYDLEAILWSGTGDVRHRLAARVGFRSVRLVQDPLEEPDQYGTGTTFFFEVNGVRMFMGGSNWIPADNFLTTITEERYRDWLNLFVRGKQNMIRVWGGGVYEPDIFYDICDELGILVWQDFQFACGVYPAHDEFVENVRKEAEDNVKRLRHHPSLALLCGNNEDYQQVLQWGGIDALPARKIYEEVLPEIVASLTDPPIPYHRGSPYGGEGWDTSDPMVGDVHQWNIWGGKELPYQSYDELGGRFVSEFGIPSMPSLETIKTWMVGAEASDWYPQSIWMAQHTKAGSFERRFAILMNENFKLTSDLETYQFTTQLLQAEAMSYAYQIWRRKWRGKGREYTGGVLIWQLNDCWPVTSWAIVDYYLRPKPAYYAIARQLATVAIGMTRTVIQNRDNDRPRQFYEFGAIQSHGAQVDVWGANSSLHPINTDLELFCIDLQSDWSYKHVRSVVLHPNQATEILSIPCPEPPPSVDSFRPAEWTTSNTVVIGARLLDPSSGQVLARSVDWPQPFKHLHLPDPQLEIKVDDEDIAISVKKPVKGLFFSVEGGTEEERYDGDGVLWNDNALDIMPGDNRVIKAGGIKGRKLYMRYLGKEKPGLIS